MDAAARAVALEKASRFAASRHELLIGGRWSAARSGRTFDSYNPATKAKLATLAAADKADADLAVLAARAALEGPLAAQKVSERAKLLWRLADLVEGHADELAVLETLDNGKPLNEARNFDIPHAIEVIRYNAGWCTKLSGETIPLSGPGNWHAYTVREPVGVVAQIVPWNAPLAMAATKIAPALAAGCAVILKPAEQTPLTALRLGELILESGFPPGVVNIVPGFGETAGAALAAHPNVDKIAFTGSTEVGRLIARAATGNLKKVSLELGGKSPNVIFADADLERAIPGSAAAIFYNQGQSCTAGSRLFVQKNVFDRVIEGVAEETKKFKLGPGIDPANNQGPVVSKEQLDRVCGYLDSGKRDGAKAVVGGRKLDRPGYFVEPTVLVDVKPEMKVVREEIFGPVVTAIPFDSPDDVLSFANDTVYGLASAVWTRDISKAHQLAAKLKAGTVWINCYNIFDPVLPFGGYKQSGWGREMGYDAIELYTEVKSVCARI